MVDEVSGTSGGEGFCTINTITFTRIDLMICFMVSILST